MVKYLLTSKAIDDLSMIWEYTYETWSESQADKYYELLTSSFEEIVQNPDLGKNYNEIDKTLFGLRVGKHIVFYRVTQSDEIEILRILHQRMDLKNKIAE
jgi:toxin ParE1/3/4